MEALHIGLWLSDALLVEDLTIQRSKKFHDAMVAHITTTAGTPALPGKLLHVGDPWWLHCTEVEIRQRLDEALRVSSSGRVTTTLTPAPIGQCVNTPDGWRRTRVYHLLLTTGGEPAAWLATEIVAEYEKPTLPGEPPPVNPPAWLDPKQPERLSALKLCIVFEATHKDHAHGGGSTSSPSKGSP